MDEEDVRAVFILCVTFIVFVALLGFFVSSCEKSRMELVSECIRAGRSSVECNELGRPHR